MVDKVARPQLSSSSSIVSSIWVDGRGSGELRASMEWASLEKIVMSVIGFHSIKILFPETTGHRCCQQIPIEVPFPAFSRDTLTKNYQSRVIMCDRPEAKHSNPCAGG